MAEQAIGDQQAIAALQEQMIKVQTALNAMQAENAGLHAQNAQALDALREAVAARPAGEASPWSSGTRRAWSAWWPSSRAC